MSSTGEHGNDGSFAPSVSADGRYIAFWSYASNLVPDDTNRNADVFVYDRATGATELVSVSSDGVQGNSGSDHPSISADGRYVAFASDASNLVSGDSNGCFDIFVHDRQTGETVRASVSTSGVQGNFASDQPAISADGHHVAFVSSATTLVTGDTNNRMDVFVHDLVTGETKRVSISSTGVQGNSNSGYQDYPSLSADGRYVAFMSQANTLVPNDTNHCEDIFVYDTATSTIVRASVSGSGAQGDGSSFGASINSDGRYVAFFSWSTNLVSGDTNGYSDVFVHDFMSGETHRVSVSATGEEGDDSSFAASISADGMKVAYYSYASNFAPHDENSSYDVFVNTWPNSNPLIASVSSTGDYGNDTSDAPCISGDGSYVAFQSWASNLVLGDNGGYWDVFVHKNGPQLPPDEVVTQSPGGWINPGWNYFSIPLDPVGSAEASDVLGFNCANRVYRWDPVGKTIQLYPDDFTNLTRGRGYLLWQTSTPAAPAYVGGLPDGNFEITLPEAGWTWIGQPFDHATLLSACSIRNNTTGVTRTATADSLAADPWANWNLPWWDSTADSWDILSLTGATNTSLLPWHGYLIWARTRDLTLIVPSE